MNHVFLLFLLIFFCNNIKGQLIGTMKNTKLLTQKILVYGFKGLKNKCSDYLQIKIYVVLYFSFTRLHEVGATFFKRRATPNMAHRQAGCTTKKKKIQGNFTFKVPQTSKIKNRIFSIF